MFDANNNNNNNNNNNTTSTVKSSLLPPAVKTLRLCRNGDPFFRGTRMVLDPRRLPSWDSFLGAATLRVAPPWGAVRKVFTTEGRRVHRLDTLRDRHTYVAAGTESFKTLDYYHISTKEPQRKKNEVIRPVVHSRILVPARWRRRHHEPRTINVFTNGDILVPPVRILIPKTTLRSWDGVLAMVSEKVRVRTGAVDRLLTLDGRLLSSAVELEEKQFYVAAGRERFRTLPYFLWIPLTRSQQGIHCDEMRKGERTHLSTDQENTHILLTTPENSVFRAHSRRSEVIGAAQVPDDLRVKVDLPIDQVEAEVVEDEEDCGFVPDNARSSTTNHCHKALTHCKRQMGALPRIVYNGSGLTGRCGLTGGCGLAGGCGLTGGRGVTGGVTWTHQSLVTRLTIVECRRVVQTIQKVLEQRRKRESTAVSSSSESTSSSSSSGTSTPSGRGMPYSGRGTPVMW